MKAGGLRDLVTIEQPATGVDTIGQPLVGWTTFDTVWADIRTTGGLESLKADKPTSVVRASVRIRALAGITTAMRLVCGSVVYKIESVPPITNGQQFMDLICEVVS